MFKLYKNLKAKDWFWLVVIIGLTVLQVWFTMSIIDYMKNVISSIVYINYHNNPKLLGDSVKQLVDTLGWKQAVEAIKSTGQFDKSTLSTILLVATATTADIWKNAGIMLGFAALVVLVQLVIAILASYISADLSTTIRKKVYDKVDDFSNNEMNKFSTASLITRTTNDIQNVQMTNVMMMRMVFTAPVTAIWAIVKIRATSTELTIATAVAVIALLIFIITMMIVVLPKFKKVQKLIDRINGISRENLTGIRVIRAFNAEDYQKEKFEQANDNLTKTQVSTGRVMSLLNPGMMIIMNGVALAIYWIGSSLINNGSIDYPTVTAFSTLSSQIIMAFMVLMMMFVLWPRASVCARRINEVLETDSSIIDPTSEKELVSKGTIEFRNVSFRYPDGDENALSNLNFSIEKGKTIAIIGATGSGKTTIVNLMMRFYDTTEGEILLNGVNIKDLKQETIHSIIGLVPQKGFLFKGTVKENVALGNPSMSLDNIKQACEVAKADEFILEKPEGYDFMISQSGKNVSGGQKQRLCIARAVAMHPEIYIFDDSFSALDYKTDKQVRDNLKHTDSDATKIIVAQRIGTIMDADMILVVEGGKIVGLGKHQELLKNCPLYLDIALSQLSKKELGLDKANIGGE